MIFAPISIASMARSSEKSNIPVLNLLSSFLNGMTMGSVNLIKKPYIFPAGLYGSLANQLSRALMTSADTKMFENMYMA